MFMINNDKQTKKTPKIKTPPPTKKNPQKQTNNIGVFIVISG